MRLSTGGREPAFTCSARPGVSCILMVGAARAIAGAKTVRAAPTAKLRRFILCLVLSLFVGRTVGQDARFIKCEKLPRNIGSQAFVVSRSGCRAAAALFCS